MRHAVSIAVVVVVGLAGLSLLRAQPAAPAAPAALGQPAPAFTLEDQNGQKVSLADHKGKVVVLEWINPECPFVVRHYKAGTMSKLAEKYRDKGVVWLAINSTHSAGNASNKKWVEAHKLAYPILNDSAGTIGKAYGAKTTPHLFIVDASGNLAYRGGIDDDPSGKKSDASNYVDKALAELTSGKTVSAADTRPYGCSVKYGK